MAVDKLFGRRFKRATIVRGEKYVEAGLVTATRLTEKRHVKAKVQNGRGKTYSCSLRLKAQDGSIMLVHSRCSCPVATACKHAAAAFLAHRFPGEAPRPASGARGAGREPTRSAPAGRAHGTTKVVLECTVPPPSDVSGHLALRLWHRDSQTGGPGVPWAPDQVLPRTGNERRIVDRLYKHGTLELGPATGLDEETNPAAMRVFQFKLEEERIGADLRFLAEAGCLVIEGPHGPASLRWSKARRLDLRWRLNDDATQSLTLGQAHVHVVPAGKAALYIDGAHGTVGELRTPVPGRMLLSLLALPPMSAAEATTFRNGLPEDLGVHVPAPTVAKRRSTEAPTPLLRVRLLEDDDDGWDDDDALDDPAAAKIVGELFFCYGATRVRDGVGDGVAFVVEGNELVEVERQTELEEGYRQQLCAALGREALPLDDEGNVELGRAKNKQDFYGAAHGWGTLLRRQGWELEGALSTSNDVVTTATPREVTLAQAGDELGWFDFGMQVDFQGQRVDLVPILLGVLDNPDWGLDADALAASGTRYIFLPAPNGGLMRVLTERIVDFLLVLRDVVVESRRSGNKTRVPLTSALDLMGLATREHLALQSTEGLGRLEQVLREGGELPPYRQPKGFLATLRPHQQAGVAWLQMLRTFDLGGILADEMGLGKTVQTLAHLCVEKEANRLTRPVLIVCPKSVVGTWCNEAARFAPDLTVVPYIGPDRPDLQQIRADVVVSTYRTVALDAAKLSERPLSWLILDEAQNVKNAQTSTHQELHRLNAAHRLLLTGTPIENSLKDLHALMDFVMPGYLGDAASFAKNFVRPIEAGDAVRSNALIRRIKPFALRRTKEEAGLGLPKKTERVVNIELLGTQRDLYETVRSAMDQSVRDAIARQGLQHSWGIVLKALTQLRQVCCDPRLLALDAARRVDESAKLRWLVDQVLTRARRGKRILVFSQFASMLELIDEALRAHELVPLMLTGQTRARQAVVDAFQSGLHPVFLISLKAGGTGLTLTRADTVVHYDPWWNPAAEDQASDRAHRIGQTRKVTVYKLIAAASVEAKMLEMQKKKRGLFEAILGGGVLRSKLAAEDVYDLFAPLGEPAPAPLALDVG